MLKLLELFDRSVYYLEGTRPAVFLLADREGGGVLINSPPFSAPALRSIRAVAPLKFLFFPSRLGARDVDTWREASGARSIAHPLEAGGISGAVDLVLEPDHRFSRTIEFLLMSGRTPGACALRCRNRPGIVFFGPILDPGSDGWPTLAPHGDDHSFENRVIGALALKDLRFDYGFCDGFEPGKSRFGPGADAAIRERIERVAS